MNKITKALSTAGVAASIALGGVAFAAVPAQAYTITSVKYIKQCIGMDLWNVKAEWINYTTLEERLGYRDHWRYTPVSLSQWHNPYCSSLSYA